ncbi:MAG: winged helix-turn-helix domain-containing protein [Acidobacteriota bacterium]
MSNLILQYKFEDYVLLPSERLLLQNGQSVPLKSKVFDTLLTLVRSAGQILTKEVLMDSIWSESFVEEGNLTQNIFMLRKLFGEKLCEHRFIVTVPGQGYKFVAKVQEITGTDIGNLNSRNGHSKNGHNKSLAVLPLKFLLAGQSTDKEHLGSAIADSLITQLNANNTISIRPTEAVLKYAETKKDSVSIGRELEVDMILSGTLQTSGEKIRANLQLHEVKTGDTLWASKIEVQSTDFFDLQDQISKQTTLELTANIRKENLPVQNTPKNLDTFQTYIKYRFFGETRTEKGLTTGLNGAEELVSSEPDYPLAYVWVADSYLLLGHHLFLAPDKVFPAVCENIKKALELDQNLAEAYATKADYYFIQRDWAQAESCHQFSMKLKPNYASERHWYSWFLTAMRRFDESLEQIEYAQMLNSNSLYLGVVRGVPLIYKREFDKAIKQFQLVLDIDPNYVRARYYLGGTLFHSGEREKGISELEKVVAAEPIQQIIGILGYCYGIAGHETKAREMLRWIDRIESKRYVSPYVRAYIHNGLGENDKALSQLEKGFDENAIWLIWLNIDMSLQSLSDEPRFKRLLQKLNFPN